MKAHAGRMDGKMAERNDLEIFPLAILIVGGEHMIRKNSAKGDVGEINGIEPGMLCGGHLDVILHNEGFA